MTAKSVALTSVIVTPPACPARRNVVRSQVMKVKDSAIRRHAGLGGAFTRVIRCGILLGTGRHPLLVVSFGFGSHWPGNGCQLNYGHWEVGWSTCPGGNREAKADPLVACDRIRDLVGDQGAYERWSRDRKSTRLNSSHDQISYAVFCLKKKKKYHNFVCFIEKKNYHTKPPINSTQQ